MGDFSKVLTRRALGFRDPALGEVAPDVTDAEEAATKAMLERWGLEAAPTAAALARRKDGKPSLTQEVMRKKVEREGQALAASVGTPLDVVKAWDKIPVPAEWERALREMSPISETVSWLMLAWKEPLFRPDLRRLVVYDCIPAAHIDPEYRGILEDRPYWELPKAERAGRARICSAFQWWKWRTHRVKAVPVLVIQGDHGGTPVTISETERKWLRMLGQRDEPYGVGDLPFAPFDERTRTALAKRDRLRKFDGRISELRKRGQSATIGAEIEAAEKEFRAAFWDHFTEQMAPIGDEWKHSIKKSENGHAVPKETREEFLQRVDARERFIETGRV